MVNYVEEARRLAEENQRRMSILLGEFQEVQEDTAKNGREFAAQAAAEMNQFWEEQAPATEQAEKEAEEKERLETEAREQREAIARSIAARKAHGTVTPVDDDDPEGEYYRRKSWLI
ncbi:hypothetical protein ACLMAJ_06480 [Nocardia sp. KC 131]|uniref:hypothetical protein n=1 Tax=Nocardia arseniciresistens TaxID=3392119 RepID=UPI00398F5E6A